MDEFFDEGTQYDFHLDPDFDNNSTGTVSCEQQILNYCSKLMPKVNFDIHVICDSGLTTITFVLPDQNEKGFLRKCGIIKVQFSLLVNNASSMTLKFLNCSCHHFENTSRLWRTELCPSCFHRLIIVKNISNVLVMSSNEYTFDYTASAISCHGPIIQLLLEYLTISTSLNNTCIGPLIFPQVAQTVKWSFEDMLLPQQNHSFIVTATLSSNISSIFWKCNSEMCSSHTLKKGASVLQEMNLPGVGKKTGLCTHLQLFINTVGLDHITLHSTKLFELGAVRKKTPPNSHFNVASGKFEFKSFSFDVLTKHNKPGFPFPAVMGFELYSDAVVQRINTLELKMMLAPFDSFGGTGLKDCTVENDEHNFKLVPEELSVSDPYYGKCFCDKKNGWDVNCRSTGTIVTVYGCNRAALCELFERCTESSSDQERNCNCTLRYNGVPDGIFMLTTNTALSCTVLDNFLRTSEWDISAFCTSMDLDYQSRLTSANYIAGRQRLFIGRHTFVKCVFAYILMLGRYREANGPPADSLLLEDCNFTTAPHTGTAGTGVIDALVNDPPMNDGTAESDAVKAAKLSDRSAALADIGRFEDAQIVAAEAISLQPLWVRPRWNLGVALQGLGKSEAALYSYYDGLLLEASNALCKEGIASINAAKSPGRSLAHDEWEFLNFRSPCPECSKDPKGQQNISLDGTMTVKHHKLRRFPGAGRSLQNAASRPRITDRFLRGVFLKRNVADTTAYTQLLKLGREIGDAIKRSSENLSALLLVFNTEFAKNPEVLPVLFFDIVNIAASPKWTDEQNVILGKFIKECCQPQCVTLWLPILAVQSLRELCNDILRDPLESMTAPEDAITVVRDHSTFFADLLVALPIMPKEIAQFLLYVCERTESVQALLSSDPVPSFSLQENSYNPVKNMESFCFIPGPLSGCTLRDMQTYKIDGKKDPCCPLCNKNYGHLPGSNYTMYAFCNLVFNPLSQVCCILTIISNLLSRSYAARPLQWVAAVRGR